MSMLDTRRKCNGLRKRGTWYQIQAEHMESSGQKKWLRVSVAWKRKKQHNNYLFFILNIYLPKTLQKSILIG